MYRNRSICYSFYLGVTPTNRMKIKIGKSYSRKLQDSNIGGQRYESTDFSSWIEQEVDEDKVEDTLKALGVLVRQDVKHSIDIRKEEIKNENYEEPFETATYKDDGQLRIPGKTGGTK